jgi:hypothetical protein
MFKAKALPSAGASDRRAQGWRTISSSALRVKAVSSA